MTGKLHLPLTPLGNAHCEAGVFVWILLWGTPWFNTRGCTVSGNFLDFFSWSPPLRARSHTSCEPYLSGKREAGRLFPFFFWYFFFHGR